MPEVVSGPHAVAAAVREGRAIKVVLSRTVRTGKALQAAALAERRGIPVARVEPGEVGRFAGGAATQGIAASCAPAARGGNWKETLELAEAGERIALLLDGVEDPRNFGACLRTAAAFGVDCVLVPKHGAAPLSAVARRAAAGAAESAKVHRTGNFPHVALTLKRMGFVVVAAVASAKRSIYELDLAGDVAWILGGEGRGVRRVLADRADFVVSIPMRQGSESLNVSVAAGVCLAETMRQRGYAQV